MYLKIIKWPYGIKTIQPLKFYTLCKYLQPRRKSQAEPFLNFLPFLLFVPVSPVQSGCKLSDSVGRKTVLLP